MHTAAEWREFFAKPGAQAECQSPSWLTEGCPRCGGKRWEVTDDAWAYCLNPSCRFATSTAWPFTRHTLAVLNADGSVTPYDFDD